LGALAFLFPGQGAQQVGMGQALAEAYPAAARTFTVADEVLGFPLSQLCASGPIEELTLTENAQAAIFVSSVAALAPLTAAGIEAQVALGHSLGEYTAVHYAGCLSFEETLLLVRRRGQYMAECGQDAGGAMAAVLGLEDDRVVELATQCAAGRVLCAANFNTPGQVVVSGEASAVEDLCRAAPEAGASRVVPLAVSGAFHTPLMAAAADRLAADLDAAPLGDARIPVVVNATAEPLTRASDIRGALKRQVTASVLWRRSLELLPSLGIAAAIEVGARNVLAGMVKRTVRDIPCASVYDAESAAKVIAGSGS